MRITYKTRRTLHRVGTVVVLAALLLALCSFCWNIWVARYVVYTREGATLDFTRDPLPSDYKFATPPRPTTAYPSSITKAPTPWS